MEDGSSAVEVMVQSKSLDGLRKTDHEDIADDKKEKETQRRKVLDGGGLKIVAR